MGLTRFERDGIFFLVGMSCGGAFLFIVQAIFT